MDSKQNPESAGPPPPYYGAGITDGYAESAPLTGMPSAPNSQIHQQPAAYYTAQGYPTQGYPPQVHSQPGYPAGSYQQPYGQPFYDGQGVIVTQPVMGQQVFMVSPPNHSLLAWLTCLFCCWPLGLVAILKSSEVDKAVSRGDLVGARNASDSARKFGYASLGFGIGSYVISIALLVIYFFVVLRSIPQYN